jgi:predicted O-methyltransferase YrrM
MPTFTTDWFSYAIPNFEAISRHMGPVPRILEIGVYQGRATCWMLTNMLASDGVITCVDPFCDTDETPWTTEAVTANPDYNADRLALFQANTEEVRGSGQTVTVRVGRSYRELAHLITAQAEFDFIYVDGNHYAANVLADVTQCFGLLRPGGIMLFDDYLWDHDPDWLHRPKMSIDAFVNMYQPYLRQIISNYQLAIQRVK